MLLRIALVLCSPALRSATGSDSAPTFHCDETSTSTLFESASCVESADGSANESGLGVFEGVEKRIEVRFHVAADNTAGLRALERKELDDICTASKCTIIHSEPDDCFDSYILSESSLFVFRDRIMIKTCGTTAPLNGVKVILDAAKLHDIEPLHLVYSRSSFVFPDLQQFPHDTLGNELDFLNQLGLSLEVVDQNSRVMGDPLGTYWLVHSMRFGSSSAVKSHEKYTIDCIMTGLAPEACAAFWKDAGYSDHRNDAAMSASIESFDPTLRVVGKAFDPCGFSANVHGVGTDNYLSVHVTPQEEFSYASVEGSFNSQFGQIDLTAFVQRVVDVFRPKKLLVTLITEGAKDIAPGTVVDKADSSSDYHMHSFGSWPVPCMEEPTIASAILYFKASASRYGVDP
jgi:S-adenosylmethionine decarboxylase